MNADPDARPGADPASPPPGPPQPPSAADAGRAGDLDAAASTTAGALLRQSLRWAALGCAALGTALGVAALGFGLDPRSVGGGAVTFLIAAFAVGWISRTAAARPQRALAMVLGVIVAGTTVQAVVTGLGVHSVVLGAYAVVVAVAGQFFGWRRAWLAAAGCFALVLALAAGERAGYFSGQVMLPSMSTGHRILAHGVLLALALATGWVMGALLRSAQERARQSEQRFRQIVGLSADWYWEQDAELRFTRVDALHGRRPPVTPHALLGRRRWELGGFIPDQGHWEAHQQDLRARRAFRDLRLIRSRPGSPDVLLSVSGEPSFDAQGRFRGYWGVARDITAQEQARLRFDAMLGHAMVGIAFTRDRRVLHVNDHFARMLGWEPAELVGQPGAVVWPSAEAYHAIGRAHGPALARGEGIDFEHQLRRRDGSLLLAHIRACAIDPRRPAEGGTIWVAEDITARREADLALAAARDAAEAASRAKTRFLANTSHELRTPLNGVIGLTQLALDAGADPKRQREYLTRIHDSAHSLTGIINDILDLSKIEADRLELERSSFALGELLQAIHGAYRELAAAKDLGFELVLDPALPSWVEGDAVRVRQILTNLLSNAIKFTEAGTVGLRANLDAQDPQQIRFEVEDTGIGISEPELAGLFRPFSQADQSTTRRFGGSGLGLSICRELAHLMGGEVGVRSEPGRGSLFWVRLSLPAAAPAPTPAPAERAAQDLRGVRVLLVEDNPVNLLIAQTLLERWGVEVIAATDGRQALEQVQALGLALDLVLMDVHMPVMGGLEATAAIRERYSAEELPVIALTAAALVSERDQGRALGMNDFITKPYDAARLHAVLQHWRRQPPAGATPAADAPAGRPSDPAAGRPADPAADPPTDQAAG